MSKIFPQCSFSRGATNKTALFVLRKGERQKYPANYTYFLKKASGRKGSFDYDTSLEEVIQKLTFKKWRAEPADLNDPTSAWLTGNEWVIKIVKKVLGKSDYQAHAGVYTGGANAVYWFDILKDHGDGTVTARNITEKAKRKIESVQVRLESELLHPLLKGQDVGPWRARPSAHLLFVQDVSKRRGIDEKVIRTDYPLVHEWLRLNREMLLQRAAYRRYFDSDTAPFYSMFDVGDYTIKPWKVIWPRVRQTSFGCCGFQGKREGGSYTGDFFVRRFGHSERSLLCGRRSQLDAFPLCRQLLFSTWEQEFLERPSILKKARVPKFDPEKSLHQKIGTEAKRLSKGAADAGRSHLPRTGFALR